MEFLIGQSNVAAGTDQVWIDYCSCLSVSTDVSLVMRIVIYNDGSDVLQSLASWYIEEE